MSFGLKSIKCDCVLVSEKIPIKFGNISSWDVHQSPSKSIKVLHVHQSPAFTRISSEFWLSFKYESAAQLRRNGSCDYLNFLFTCLTSVIYIEFKHCAHANSGLLAIDSFFARRDLLQLFWYRLLWSKKWISDIYQFACPSNDVFWIDTSRIQKKNSTVLRLNFSEFCRNNFL